MSYCHMPRPRSRLLTWRDREVVLSDERMHLEEIALTDGGAAATCYTLESESDDFR